MTSPQHANLDLRTELEGAPIEWAADLLRQRLAETGPLTVSIGHAEHGPQGYAITDSHDGLRIEASDAVGASYALVDIVDHLASSNDVQRARRTLNGMRNSTSMPVRGIMRSFSSVDEDLPWYRDRQFWREYLDWMAQARFSRFHLAFGMQYNYGADRHGASDNYLCLAYPFLFTVPGWNVEAEGVGPAERETNLEMLKFIAAETRRRGMQFQLGLWNHAYDYGLDSQHRFPITGLTPQTHGDYAAAAIRKLVAEVPDIDGFSFRVHYEGGIHDDGHEVFWGQVFDALSATGQSFQVDMHAKGVDDALLDAVSKPGLQPVLGAKYWAEHMGLPYHQASIRRQEYAKPVPPGHEMTAVTEFSRRFTRYGYADFLNENRRADVLFRVWPGTQKVLLWADPAIAAGYGRLSTFAGSIGVDFCEPVYFKGRKGSGAIDRRDLYIDPALQLGVRDWTKYKYTYRLWGRKLYNPDAPASEWRGYLRDTYAELAEPVEQGLAPLSRILPLITVVHGVGGSNNGNWPEVYTSLPVTQGVDPGPIGGDTEQPAMWGTVSPFDPTTFYIINEWARDAVGGELDGRYTPLEVADWLDGMVQEAVPHLAALNAVPDPAPQLRRTRIDMAILSQLGRFFAHRFRSAAQYALYQVTGIRESLVEAVAHNGAARDAYAEILPLTQGVYQEDMRFGISQTEHGSWTDRYPAVAADVAAMDSELAALDGGEGEPVAVPSRPHGSGISHELPEGFSPGKDLTLSVSGGSPRAIRLNYRYVNQAEHFRTVEMTRTDGGFSTNIPGDYTGTDYPLMYFFTVNHGQEGTTVHPGLDADLSNQPYYVVRAFGH